MTRSWSKLGDAERGRTWAEGFVVGIELGRDELGLSMLNDKRAVEIVASIMALARDDRMMSSCPEMALIS